MAVAAKSAGKRAPGRSKPTASAPEAAPPAGPATRYPLLPVEAGARWTLFGLLAVALGLRTVNLTGMFPILVDEAIYLRWAEIIQHQGQWFISLLDGKPPLSYWFLALARFVSGADPLLQGRLISALAGTAATFGIFQVGRRIAEPESSERAGLAAAGLYAVFPWALLYDRLAYTEAWVNLFGVAIAWTSLLCFEQIGRNWSREVPPGLALGLGLFTKQTAILFGLVPLAAAYFYGRGGSRSWIVRAAVIYAIAALFLAANFILTPEAPTLATHDAVLHHTGFFANPQELMADPFVAARSNFPKLLSYIGTYVTWPAALAALASAVWLARRRSFAPWLLLAGALVPVTAEAFLLELMFPSRYPFPHFWPWLAVAAVGVTAAADELAPAGKKALAWAGLLALVAAPLLWRDARMLGEPEQGLHASDAEGFLGDHAHVGYGIAEAIDFLRNEARSGPYVLLTDPIWGPPADAIFPYLNQRYGIRVFEAWWTQLSPNHSILPQGEAEVLRSHYERVSAGSVDFRQVPRVFYVTDTHYYPREAVLIRQPNAQLVASFPKRNGHSIDVYRLK
ncbi:MAG: hypothetical protein GC160_12755 [Acidobacteria bacterium]|nr:hypothetical protein [Acidobacteriota bacterium]